MAMPTEEQRKLIKQTLPLVKARMLLITTRFYSLIFETQHAANHMFNKSHHKSAGKSNEVSSHSQPKAISNALLCIAQHLEQITQLLESKEGRQLLDQIVAKHVSCMMTPELYVPVGELFVQAIQEILGQNAATAPVLDAWSAFYYFCADLLIEREEKLYQMLESTPGGWRGGRPFIVQSKIIEEPDTVSDHEDKRRKWISLYLTSKDGKPVMVPRPGQYITFRIKDQERDIDTIRHFTVSDLCFEGGTGYRVTLNVIVDGLVSNWILEHLHIGDELEVYPPVGNFGLSPQIYEDYIYKVDEIAAQNGITFPDDILSEQAYHPLGLAQAALDARLNNPIDDNHTPEPSRVFSPTTQRRGSAAELTVIHPIPKGLRRRPQVFVAYSDAILPPKELLEQENFIIKQPKNPHARRPHHHRTGSNGGAGSRRPSLDSVTHTGSTGNTTAADGTSEPEPPIKLLFCAYNSGVTPYVGMAKEIVRYTQKLKYLNSQGIQHDLKRFQVTILHFVKQSTNWILGDEFSCLQETYPYIRLVPIFYHKPQFKIIEWSSPTTFLIQLCKFYAQDVDPSNCYIIGSHTFLREINYCLQHECNFDTSQVNYEFLGPRQNFATKSEVI